MRAGGELGRPTEPGWVLVVVEDVTRGMALFRLLEWAGHRATVVDTGEEAVAMLRSEPFDLVLLDASMPEKDVSEVLRGRRVHPRLKRVPVLMVIPEADVDAVGPWIDMGADDVVTEPLVPVLARARISASLARKRLADRDVEHRGEIRRIVEAVIAARDGTIDGHRITAIARCDPPGRLAQALRQTAAEGKQAGTR